MKKEVYLDIMDRALDAYTMEELRALTEENRKNGVTEHGFPRIAANIGILIAHGRKTALKELWIEMMDVATEGAHLAKNKKQKADGTFERWTAGNDFFIKELAFAVMAYEKCEDAEPQIIARWKRSLSKVIPEENYNAIAKTPTERVGNWAAYNVAGEWMLKCMGLADRKDYIDFQLSAQLCYTDEMGLYRDPHEPMLYDLATRAQFAVMLHFGYDGACAEEMSEKLRTAGLFTLKMQSACGEIGFGGRSNQFLFNEAYLAACMEFEATRYQKKGNRAMASVFKRSAALATRSILDYLTLAPEKHVKNRFPRDLRYGQEPYAYFDKYMVSLASFIYLAYCMADDAIDEGSALVENASYVAETTDYFHKIFAASHGYSIEIDTAADFHYDATGLGRIHKAGNYAALALSVPFTKEPNYFINAGDLYANKNGGRMMDDCGGIKSFNDTNPCHLAITPIVTSPDGTRTSLAEFSTGLSHELIVEEESVSCVAFRVRYSHADFVGCTYIEEVYRIDESGVRVTFNADVAEGASLSVLVPLFVFDGKEKTNIAITGTRATVSYGKESYSVVSPDASLSLTPMLFKNRNGIYRAAEILGKDSVTIRFSLG